MSRHTRHLSHDPDMQKLYHAIPKRKAWKMRKTEVIEAWGSPSIWIIHRNRGRVTIKVRHVDLDLRTRIVEELKAIAKRHNLYLVDDEKGILYKPKGGKP